VYTGPGSYPSPIPNPGPYPNPGGPGSSSEAYQAGYAYLTRLSENSGGLVFDGRNDLRYAFAQVAKELASQYSIGYYSNDKKHDGKFRKVEVRVNNPGYAARTKKGYYAKKDK
jgi:VWFA-related protein